MQFQELVKSVLAEYGPELVCIRIAELHHEEINEGHYVAMCALDTKLVPVVVDPPVVLDVQWDTEIAEDGTARRYPDVSSQEGEGLELSVWPEWAGFTVPQEPGMPPIDFVAACIWEMTFAGYEEHDVEELNALLSRRIAEYEMSQA